MSNKTDVEKWGRQATRCDANGEVHLSHIKGKCRLVEAKLPGTTFDGHGSGPVTSGTLTLPAGTRPGQGGSNLFEDDAGQFRVSAVMPGEVAPEDF